MPFFSVIIPTYNRAHFISKGIESILAQSFKDWELIIVDDGSTDDTKQVVSAYNDTRIKYIFQQNAERCVARNKGINQAGGRYICFLDSDDYFLFNRLELLYNELEKRHFPISAFFTGVFFENGGVMAEFKEFPYDAANTLDSIALAVIGSMRICISTPILRQHRFDDRFHIGEDMELWLRIANEYDFIFLENQLTVVAVEHEEQSVSIAQSNTYAEQLKTLNFIFSDGHPGHKISPKVKSQILGYCYYGMARYFIYNDKRWLAAAKTVRSIMTDPRSIYLKFRLNILLKLGLFSPMARIKEMVAFQL